MAILPVFCCGFECGLLGTVGQHWSTAGAGAAPTIITSGHRSGLRAVKFAASASANASYIQNTPLATSDRWIGRFYVYFVTLPTDTMILASTGNATPEVGCNIEFSHTDNKLYAQINNVRGAGQGISAGQWNLIEFEFRSSATNLISLKVNGVSLGFHTGTGLGSDTQTVMNFGIVKTDAALTTEFYIDDIILSHTSVDHGAFASGKVLSYIPNADGTHNVAGGNDFERTLTGTDILNSTTDAFELVNDRPLESAAGDFINMVVPAGANDWVECAFENSAEATAPRTVELIAAIHQAGTGLGNMEIILVDNGTDGTIYTATGVAGATVLSYKRAHFADPPSAATAWVLGGAINGDFNNLLVRFTSPAAVDANPDQYFDCIMIEAEYAEVIVIYRELSISPPPYLQVTRVVAY